MLVVVAPNVAPAAAVWKVVKGRRVRVLGWEFRSCLLVSILQGNEEGKKEEDIPSSQRKGRTSPITTEPEVHEYCTSHLHLHFIYNKRKEKKRKEVDDDPKITVM